MTKILIYMLVGRAGQQISRFLTVYNLVKTKKTDETLLRAHILPHFPTAFQISASEVQ